MSHNIWPTFLWIKPQRTQLMALVEINWQPTRTDLKVFGIGLAIFCTIVGVLVYRMDREFGFIESAFACIAVIALMISLIQPTWLKPIYLLFTVLAFPIGWVVSHLLLATVFFMVFTPTGLLMRLFGRDPLHRHFDSSANSYWVAHRSSKSPEDYFRQF